MVILFLFGQHAPPKVIPELFSDLPVCDFYVIEIMEGNCFVVNSWHTLVEFLAECRRSDELAGRALAFR